MAEFTSVNVPFSNVVPSAALPRAELFAAVKVPLRMIVGPE